MLDKLASWDTIDFSSSSDAEITKILKELNIALSVDEVKKTKANRLEIIFLNLSFIIYFKLTKLE